MKKIKLLFVLLGSLAILFACAKNESKIAATSSSTQSNQHKEQGILYNINHEKDNFLWLMINDDKVEKTSELVGVISIKDGLASYYDMYNSGFTLGQVCKLSDKSILGLAVEYDKQRVSGLISLPISELDSPPELLGVSYEEYRSLNDNLSLSAEVVTDETGNAVTSETILGLYTDFFTGKNNFSFNTTPSVRTIYNTAYYALTGDTGHSLGNTILLRKVNGKKTITFVFDLPDGKKKSLILVFSRF